MKKNLLSDMHRILRGRSGDEYPSTTYPPSGREGIDVVHQDDDDFDEGDRDA